MAGAGFSLAAEVVVPMQSSPHADRGSTAAAAGGVHPGSAEVEFCVVEVAYRPDQPVLRGVSFKVPAGRTLGIVGPTGSGKSTIVRLLTRMLEPDSGEVRIDHTSSRAMELSTLRQAIAIVPQDNSLFDGTIAENIGMGRPGSSREDIQHAAQLAEADHFIVSLSEGYETRVGERGFKLSGGERQRIAIARAILKSPRVYLFDEATSWLDNRTEGDIQRKLFELSRHTTTLIIAHRLSSVVRADQIIYLDEGVITEQGTHDSLLAAGGHYASLWLLQQRGAATA